MKTGPKEIAEAMAAEGVEPDVIKRVLLNLGFSQEEVIRATARACIITTSPSFSKEGGQAQGQRGGVGRTAVKEGDVVPHNVKELQRRLSVLEGRVTALIDLLSDYVPAIVEKVRAKELNDGGVRSFV
ncbi:MAG: hypothetical protein QXT74_04765 [Candidatus Nezhaarchaeales archaeon]